MSARRPLHTWERLSAEIVYECRIFSLRRDRSRFSRDDAEHEFHVLESPDWCNIIPLTADERARILADFDALSTLASYCSRVTLLVAGCPLPSSRPLMSLPARPP